MQPGGAYMCGWERFLELMAGKIGRSTPLDRNRIVSSQQAGEWKTPALCQLQGAQHLRPFSLKKCQAFCLIKTIEPNCREQGSDKLHQIADCANARKQVYSTARAAWHRDAQAASCTHFYPAWLRKKTFGNTGTFDESSKT
eukprot:scaffold262031_cov18-Tisochrysis_lutea.AAC.1